MPGARDNVISASFRTHGSVSPSDSTELRFDGLYIGGSGDVAIRDAAGNAVTYVGIPAGTFMPVAGDRVMESGTDATSIVWGLF
jgi:hypothetical protein